MKKEEVPQWIIDCVTDMFDCEGEDMWGNDDFCSAVETITQHYFHYTSGIWQEINIPRQ